jgi:uncharacterized membrane protein YgdD (TMEM256/DUF423 family)
VREILQYLQGGASINLTRKEIAIRPALPVNINLMGVHTILALTQKLPVSTLNWAIANLKNHLLHQMGTVIVRLKNSLREVLQKTAVQVIAGVVPLWGSLTEPMELKLLLIIVMDLAVRANGSLMEVLQPRDIVRIKEQRFVKILAIGVTQEKSA